TSLCILDGFKTSIKEKIFSFGAHIHLTKYDADKSYEESPFIIQSNILDSIKAIPTIQHIQGVSHKPCLLKSSTEIQGVILKGVGKDFDINRFKDNIIDGSFITFNDSTYSKQIVISDKIAGKLSLKTGDSLLLYFVQNPPRYRKVVVSGIYQTGLEELDELFIIGDIQLNRVLSGWSPKQIGGLEIYVSDFNQLDSTASQVYKQMDYYMQIQLITDKYLQIFDWLNLLNRNVSIFLALIMGVSSFVIIATIIVMVMERTPMIGLLKAFGTTNKEISRIFLWNGFRIILIGMITGNAVALGLCAIQYYTGIVPLDAENYFMSSVPIEFPWFAIVLVNVGALLSFIIILGAPVTFISRVTPVKAIKFN
ncbi:MAG TPA: FtsX-like permease family protein, partial [Cytophaga sp.]|nr:FtsX-like permease family protein [Cytophaga sp.]